MRKRWKLKRINPSDKKRRIIYALSLLPMSRKRLGEVVGTYRLHEFLADLTHDRFIISNQSTGCYELAEDVGIIKKA